MNSRSFRDPILRLYPGAAEPIPLAGLYLSGPWHPAGTPSRPCVYADFIASLDGRISLPHPVTGTRTVPRAIANSRDWRLFQELAASADVLLTTGRHIRDLAAGDDEEDLPLSGKPEFADLHAWRRAHGLSPQPAVVIVSASLNLPIPESLLRSGRRIYIATGAAADAAVVASWTARGVRVLEAGSGNYVGGRELVTRLTREGFGSIDMIGGSVLLNTLLVDSALDRLYLTQACRIVGGLSFDTLIKGGCIEPPADFELRLLCYDSKRSDAAEQLFAMLECTR